MDKFEHVCREYAKWNSEIKRLSFKIGEHLSDCMWNQYRNHVSEQQTHLKQAYASWLYDPEKDCIVYHGPTPEEYLKQTCNHCYHAHLLIQERKEARKQFGIAKRRISQICK